MDDQIDKNRADKTTPDSIGTELFTYLGKAFPVCCESDEFYYFPQIFSHRTGWTSWDDFTPDKIQEVSKKLSRWEHELASLSRKPGDPDTIIDGDLLLRMSRTLREQLTEVRFQESQPTFYLTIASTGLAGSLESSMEGAWEERIGGIPLFLDLAKESLTRIPSLFRDMGLQMADDVSSWLKSLDGTKQGVPPALEALDDFKSYLRNTSVLQDYLLPAELVERVMSEHTGWGMGTYEARLAIEEEIEETAGIMDLEAGKILPGSSWVEALKNIPFPQIPDDGPEVLYRSEIENLLHHCIDTGIVSEKLARINPVTVSEVPSFLAAIRAASSYSYSPGEASGRGTFYVVPRKNGWDNSGEDLVDYRMLTAHETYPGHHLLDSSRWNLGRRLRRPIETPLFYEGWACFAEELMKITGYFSGPEDFLLLAKRRYRRALRGLIDLNIQTRKMDITSAAKYLSGSVFTMDAALSVAPKYALRPGYQICYALGLRRFLDFYERYGDRDPPGFARKVLSQGEVAFHHLEKILSSS